jgi:hypothetical protein
MANIFQHMKKGIHSYRANFAPYLLANFIIFLVAISVVLLGALLVLYNSESILYSDEFLNNSVGSDLATLAVTLFTPTNLLIFLAFFTIAILLGTYLSSGIYGICLEGAKGKTSLKTFFGTILRRGGTYMIATLVMFILMTMLMVALIFPVVLTASLVQSYSILLIDIYILSISVLVLILSPYFMFVPISVVWGKGVTDAFKQSFAIGRENYFEVLALQAILYAVSISVGMLPIIGFILQILIVTPVMLFTLCSYYQDRNSSKKTVEAKPKPKAEVKPLEVPIEDKIARAKRVPARETKAIVPEMEEVTVPEFIEPKKDMAKTKADLIKSASKKKRRKKSGVYIVASKKPIRVSHKGERRTVKKAQTAKKSARKPALKKPVRRAKRK